MFSKLSKAIKWIGDHFKGLLFLLIASLLLIPTPKEQLLPPNLQEIQLFGAITDASAILKTIEQAQKDAEDYKGHVEKLKPY